MTVWFGYGKNLAALVSAKVMCKRSQGLSSTFGEREEAACFCIG